MTQHWAEQYVGIPFQLKGRTVTGVDCWGLVALVLHERFGIELPSYDDGYKTVAPEDHPAIADLFENTEIPNRHIAIGDERPGDVVVLRLNGYPVHYGVIIERGRFLHCLYGRDSTIESISSIQWQTRIVGIFRHQALND